MTTTSSTDHRHADVGGRNRADGSPPALPPVTWDPACHPTAAEWIGWFLTMSGRQREYVVASTLDMAQRGARCATMMHEEQLQADTLTGAQIAVQAHLDDPEGIRCPCCGQLAKRYRRKITSQVARALITMFRETNKWEQRQASVGFFDTVTPDDPAYPAGVRREHGLIYLHLPTLLGKTADEAKAAYWGLIEPLPDAKRDDGSTRTGWWTLTALGRVYVRGEVSLPRYKLVFDGKVQGAEGASVGIRDALGARFNYGDLMAGR